MTETDPQEDENAETETNSAIPSDQTMYEVPISNSRGQTILHPDRDQYLDTIKKLSEDGFKVCIDVTAVDYLENPERDLPNSISPERFEVVINLLSHQKKERLRLRIQVPEGDPVISSIFDFYPGSLKLPHPAPGAFLNWTGMAPAS